MRARAAAAAALLRDSPLAVAVLAASALIAVVRLAGDVHGKPLFEDEAVAGLVSARPLVDVLASVWDRGGAPAHFLLAHAVLAARPSADALRWLSFACALATLPVSFDLGRRLGGPTAGGVTALVVAASGMLGVYGTFGRMYALFALAAAAGADLFVAALSRPTPGRVGAACAAAWLVAAVHPYGAFFVGAEAIVALAVWRGRNGRAVAPAAAALLALAPLAVLDLRLAHRFRLGVGGGRSLSGPAGVRDDFVHAFGGFAGGHGAALAAFAAVAAAGLLIAARRHPAYAAFVALSLGLPFAVLLVASSGRHPDLSPRHLIFALPLYASLIGVAAGRAADRLPGPGRALLVAGAAAAALATAGGVHDPRGSTYVGALGTRADLRSPAAWLRGRIGAGDVLYPYSAVFLAALPEAAHAVSLPRAMPGSLVSAVRRVDYPAGAVVVAVPADGARLAPAAHAAAHGRRVTEHRLGAWLLLRAGGPHSSPAAVLASVDDALLSVRAAEGARLPAALSAYLRYDESVVCAALRSLVSSCPRE